MRSKKSALNMFVSLVTQIILLVIKFASRIFFVRLLGQEYYGLSGLFTNILSMLSLAELGIGSAITFSLYNPLSNDDNKKISAIVNFYKKTYNIIGIVILILGTCLTPFLSIFIKEMPSIENIPLIFELFVINSAISYFFSYNTSLLIADQKQYVYSINRTIFNICLCIVQVVSLYSYGNYILYLIIQILFTFLENVCIYIITKRNYPFLKEYRNEKIDKADLSHIIKNTSSLILQKISGIIVSSTDNILISKFIGVATVGIYSNYSLIISSLDSLLFQVIKAATASIGNLGVENDKEKLEFIHGVIMFLFFWIFCFVFIELMININLVIKILFGKEYVYSNAIVFILCFKFYLEGMRRPNGVYLEALGLFWNQRYKAIFEMIFNLVFSIFLISKYGIVGIFLGTILSGVFTNYWIEPYLLYRDGFSMPIKKYIQNYFKYLITTFSLLIISYVCCSMITFGNLFVTVIVNILIVFFVVNLSLFVIFRKNIYLKYIIQKLIIFKNN